MQLKCHTTVGDSHKLKEFRLLLATIVPDSERLCTECRVDFSSEFIHAETRAQSHICNSGA